MKRNPTAEKEEDESIIEAFAIKAVQKTILISKIDNVGNHKLLRSRRVILLRPDGELKRPDRQKDTWQASMCCTQRQIRERKRKCVEGQIAHNCTQRKEGKV